MINLNSVFAASAYYSRAVAFANQGEFELALQDIDQTLVVNPKYAIAYFLRAQIFDYQGKFADALKNYQTFMKLAGGPVDPAVIDRVKELIAILSHPDLPGLLAPLPTPTV